MMKCMHYRFNSAIFAAVVVMALFASCRNQSTQLDSNFSRGAYYWKTTFALSPEQIHYLDSTATDRLYVKFFDVDDVSGSTIPVGTITFKEPVPQNIEIVPCVYLVNDVFVKCAGGLDDPEELAQKVEARLMNMLSYNEIDSVKEIQVDCDWTRSSESAFFQFCSTLSDLLHANGITLSCTLRLWQITEAVPPVDRVVLMLYNTGDFSDFNTRNSILDYEEVCKYIRNGTGYALPLDIALPQFEWTLGYYADSSFCSIVSDTAGSPAAYFRHESVSDALRDSVLDLALSKFHTVNKNPKITYFSL